MGSYRISIPRTGTVSGPGDTTPPVESYDLGPKIRAAVAAGGFVFIGGTVLLWSVLAIAWMVGADPPWQIFVLFAAIAFIIGLGTTCWFGFGWSIRVATRALDVDDTEISRRHQFEDEALEAQKELAKTAGKQVRDGDDKDGNPLTLTDKQCLDLAALNMLERVYIYGRPATRDAMTRDGACDQLTWNLVNAGMKAIGLRKKQTWQPSDFGTAWALWRENVRLETHDGSRYLMVLKQNGQWHALERIE